MRICRGEKGFVGLLSILIVLIIVGWLVSKTYWTNFNTLRQDKQTEKVLSDQGIDTSSSQKLLDSTKAQIHRLQKMEIDRQDEILNSYGR